MHAVTSRYLLKQWLQSPSEMRFKDTGLDISVLWSSQCDQPINRITWQEIFLEVMDALPSIVRPLPASVASFVTSLVS